MLLRSMWTLWRRAAEVMLSCFQFLLFLVISRNAGCPEHFLKRWSFYIYLAAKLARELAPHALECIRTPLHHNAVITAISSSPVLSPILEHTAASGCRSSLKFDPLAADAIIAPAPARRRRAATANYRPSLPARGVAARRWWPQWWGWAACPSTPARHLCRRRRCTCAFYCSAGSVCSTSHRNRLNSFTIHCQSSNTILDRFPNVFICENHTFTC